MQQSRRRLGYLWPLLAVACGGFAPRDFGAKASGSAAGGIAGFSYDAGALEGGKASVSPPSSTPNDWRPREPSGGESGAPDDAGVHPPTHHSETDGGAGGEPSDSDAGSAGAGRASGAAGHAGAGQGSGSGSGAGGHAGRGGASGHGGGATNGGANGHGGGAGTGAGGQAARGGSSGSSGGTGGASSGGTFAGGGAGTTGNGGGSPALFFSEYVEGGHKDKALELCARVAASLDGCRIVIYSNGHTDETTPTALEGQVHAGDTYVLCNSSLAEVLGATCNRAANLNFNGNDAITLECDGVVIDAIGQVGFDPKPAWSVAGVSTLDQTLRRRCSIAQGDPLATDAFDPSVEWASHPVDDFSGLGSPDCD